MKRQVEERGEHGGVAGKCGVREEDRDAGRDQYNRVMICSLRGSGGTALSDIRDQSMRVCVCVHKCQFAFLLLSMVDRKRNRLGFSCCVQATSNCLRKFNYQFRNY